jgi:hypothetical protein
MAKRIGLHDVVAYLIQIQLPRRPTPTISKDAFIGIAGGANPRNGRA